MPRDFVTPDTRGRVNLRKYLKPGTEHYVVRLSPGGVITLEPGVVVTDEELNAKEQA